MTENYRNQVNMITNEDIRFYFDYLKIKFKKIDFSKYYLAYSGGRDSHFLYWFIKNILSDHALKIVSVNTQMEHKEIRERMQDNADVVLFPIMKHKEIKEKFGSPCFTKQQDEYIDRYQKGNRSYNTMKFILGTEKTMFKMSKKPKELLLKKKLHKISNKCCDKLKKEPMKKYEKEHHVKPILGLRQTEGIMRNKIKSCNHKNGTFTPIFNLSDEMLEAIEHKYNIPVPKVYDYISRTGCMGCPYGRNIETELSLITPAQKRFIVDYFKESYEIKGVNVKTTQKRLVA